MLLNHPLNQHIKNLVRKSLIFLLVPFYSVIADPELIKIRIGQQKGQLHRIVFDVSEEVNWKTIKDAVPNTLDIEINALKKKTKLPNNNGILQNIQLSNPISLQFIHPIVVKKSFSIPANEENAFYRIVVDIECHKPLLHPPSVPLPSPSLPKIPLNLLEENSLDSVPKLSGSKIIIIDPGHGGEDPGALGPNYTKEKDITLMVAKKLKKALEMLTPHKIYLTRETDIFVRLTDRVKFARKMRGDLFVSLHADSHPSKKPQGLSIYTLSSIASDKDTARLAAKENKADLIMGMELEMETPEVANILIDLVKRETMNMAGKFAIQLITGLGKQVELLQNTHRFAAFYVLRAPEIPSVLIELGFLSSKKEEALLNSSNHQQKIVNGIVEAIQLYFK